MARKPSIWLTERYVNSKGHEYQRYVLDANGNRVLRDPNVTPESIVKETTTREQRQKKAVSKINRLHKKMHSKHPVPIFVLGEMRRIFDLQKKNEGNIRSSEFVEKNAEYHVVLFNSEKDWLLIHALIKKAVDYEDKWFFFNPYNEAVIPFIKEVHKPGHGDHFIQWPEKDTSPETTLLNSKRKVA